MLFEKRTTSNDITDWEIDKITELLKKDYPPSKIMLATGCDKQTVAYYSEKWSLLRHWRWKH